MDDGRGEYRGVGEKERQGCRCVHFYIVTTQGPAYLSHCLNKFVDDNCIKLCAKLIRKGKHV